MLKHIQIVLTDDRNMYELSNVMTNTLSDGRKFYVCITESVDQWSEFIIWF